MSITPLSRASAVRTLQTGLQATHLNESEGEGPHRVARVSVRAPVQEGSGTVRVSVDDGQVQRSPSV